MPDASNPDTRPGSCFSISGRCLHPISLRHTALVYFW